MLRSGYSARNIAKTLDRHQRTIEREIARGRVEHRDGEWRTKTVYSSDRGQDVHDLNATAKGPDLKLGRNYEMVDYVRSRILEHRESPAVVVFRMRENGMKGAVCTKTLYNYIDVGGLIDGVSNESLWEKRKRKRNKRKTVRRHRKKYTNRQSIEKRPEHVNNREKFGHWEIDLILGPKGSKATLLTLIERKTRKVIMRKLKNKTNREVVRELNRIERELGAVKFRKMFKSITADNGSEFLNVEELQNSVRSGKCRTCLFYAHPYASWERGSNENVNKMIRRFIAKGTKIEKFSRARIKGIEQWINNYPRKIIGFSSSKEVFEKETRVMVA
jgi:IS30 family transposase